MESVLARARKDQGDSGRSLREASAGRLEKKKVLAVKRGRGSSKPPNRELSRREGHDGAHASRELRRLISSQKQQRQGRCADPPGG